MLRKIISRLLLSIPILIGVILVIFIMLRIVPGDPVTTMLGEHVNPVTIEKIRNELGLDEPLYIQFYKYVLNAFKGNFGTSYRLNRDVSSMIIEAFPNTLKLSISASIFAWAVGISSGIVSAIYKNKIIDKIFMTGALFGVSMPIFMLALVLQYLFTFKLKIFPTSGYDTFLSMILPAVALGWNSAGSIARMTRANLIEVLREDYIKTARAKGLSEKEIVFIHALRNALLPIITMMTLQLSSMLSGAVITESIFGIAGVGRLAVNAIETRDMPLLQGTVLFTTIIIIFGNLFADILYSIIDPRIREVKQ